MNPADTARPGTAHRLARRTAGRVAGLTVVAAVIVAVAIPAGPAAAQAPTRAQNATAAAFADTATRGAATATPAPSTLSATAPAGTPAVQSHGNDIPAPGFTEGDGAGTLQAVLVIAIPAVPAIVMAFVVFWPRTRQPRSRPARNGRRSATTSEAGT